MVADKINVLSLFDGLGGTRIALDQLGIDCNYYASEIERFPDGKPAGMYAMKVAKHNYPNIIHIGDVTKVQGKDFPDTDLLVGGSPCFIAGTLITTTRGLVPIEEVKEGDFVLTHTNKFKKVLKIGGKKVDNYFDLKIQGSPYNQVTGNHPYYIRTMKRKWGKLNGKRINPRTWSDPYWKNVEELEKNDFIGFTINKESQNIKNITKEECWLIGRYIADGYIRDGLRSGRKNSYNNQVIICVGKHKRNDFNIKEYYIGWAEERTVYKARIINKRLMELCRECGKGAENKKIPQFIMNLSKDYLGKFLDGYMSGDGCFTNDKFKAASVSKILIYQLQQVVHKLYSTPSNIHCFKRPKTCVIEGRVVNQKDSWSMAFNKEIKKQNKAILIDGIMWYPFKDKKAIKEKTIVYNLEVEGDNSYTANNCIVHNCQNLSISKANREGLEGEQSKLFWEYVRLLKEVKPKYFILENVRSMPDKDKNIITKTLGVHPIMINSALMTAQNRKRYYWTNIPGVSQPLDRGIMLKDIIEEGSVDRDKAYCLTANYGHGTNLKQYNKGKFTRQVVFKTGIYTVPRGYNGGGIRVTDKSPPVTSSSWEHNNKLVINPIAVKGCAKRTRAGNKKLEIRSDNKANALTTVKSDSMVFIEAERSNRKSDLNYLGGIISGRNKWLQDGKNLSRNFSQGNRVYGIDGKSVTLNANGGGMGAKTGLYYTHEGIRTWTPRECEILQSIPPGYTSSVSNSQRYRMIGNGFTILVIMWILSHLELNDTSIAFKKKNQQNFLF